MNHDDKFGCLAQIGIRDNSLKLCEKERKKKKYLFFSLVFNSDESDERKNVSRKKRICFFFFLSFSQNLIELSQIQIWTRQPKLIILSFGED